MPTILTLLGMRFFYWAREHEPIHVHVQKGNAEARFIIEPDVQLTDNKGFKPHELSLAEEVIKDNREYMIEHWKLFFKTTNV
ncbi:MAG: DUF4160 domain-containing protein [Prevotellaceae bacterium]|jgi:hypothetical protein|nr:DUF4160 domain-containing protein [Prevotellaceae bacterium]